MSDFFDDQVLHSIRLVINPRDWQELKANFQLNTYYPCHFIWRNQIVRNVAIRSRGTGSRSGSKPGLRIDFNLFDEHQQFLGLKSVVLRNNVQDATNLHERVGMQFFTKLGLAAPREAHTRLYVNDEYAGLYSIVDPSTKSSSRRGTVRTTGICTSTTITSMISRTASVQGTRTIAVFTEAVQASHARARSGSAPDRGRSAPSRKPGTPSLRA